MGSISLRRAVFAICVLAMFALWKTKSLFFFLTSVYSQVKGYIQHLGGVGDVVIYVGRQAALPIGPDENKVTNPLLCLF